MMLRNVNLGYLIPSEAAIVFFRENLKMEQSFRGEKMMLECAGACFRCNSEIIIFTQIFEVICKPTL